MVELTRTVARRGGMNAFIDFPLRRTRYLQLSAIKNRRINNANGTMLFGTAAYVLIGMVIAAAG
jgi:hypothetical protein